MDSYLTIAERVLRAARRPMTAKAILHAALRAGIVPDHLRGETQHKTLQARLSEEILHKRLEGRFFRTDPGYFFLTELREDPHVPNRFKDPFHARRRTRDLNKAPALAIDRKFAKEHASSSLCEWANLLQHASDAGAIRYIDPSRDSSDSILIWAFSVVRREQEILTYRMGRYRDDRDSFANKRSIGFPEMVSYDDKTLFSHDDFGLAECGLNAVLADLDLSRSSFTSRDENFLPSVSFSLLADSGSEDAALLFVMEWECPEWFEPTARRLSLNDVRWIDARCPPNDIDSFEPWSIEAFSALLSTRSLNWGEEIEEKNSY